MEFQDKERLDRMEQHLRLIKEDLQYISSALIGSKRLFMRDHLEKNIYKGLTKPESLFS